MQFSCCFLCLSTPERNQTFPGGHFISPLGPPVFCILPMVFCNFGLSSEGSTMQGSGGILTKTSRAKITVFSRFCACGAQQYRFSRCFLLLLEPRAEKYGVPNVPSWTRYLRCRGALFLHFTDVFWHLRTLDGEREGASGGEDPCFRPFSCIRNNSPPL